MAITYTTILHQKREELGITWVEYGLCDIAYKLSTNPKSLDGWCTMRKEKLATTLGIDTRTLRRTEKALIKKGLIVKNGKGNIRTTNVWYEVVINPVDEEQSENKQEIMTQFDTVVGSNRTKCPPRPDKMSGPLHIDNNNDNNNIVSSQNSETTRVSDSKEYQLKQVVGHLETTLGSKITNWGKQAKAYSMGVKAGYTPEQMIKTITYMATKDDYFMDKGFDLMTVVNQLPRYQAAANRLTRKS